MLGQCVEQFGVCRGVRQSLIVDRFHQSPTQQVRPQPIRQVPGEPGIVGGCHPLGEGFPPLASLGHRFPPQGMWWNDRARAGVYHRSRHLGLQRVSRLGRLERHPGEERLHPEVVVLAPAVVRVMMALRALDPHPQEDLRQGAGHAPRGCHHLEEASARLLGQRAACRHNRSAKPIKGGVRRHLLPQKSMVLIRLPMPQRLPVDTQDVAPFLRPEIDKLGSLQQCFQQSGVAVGPLVGEVVAHFVRGGQGAGQVERDAAQQVGRFGGTRGDNLQLSQLGMHQPINHVGRGQFGKLRRLGPGQQGAKHIDQSHVTRHDGDIAG